MSGTDRGDICYSTGRTKRLQRIAQVTQRSFKLFRKLVGVDRAIFRRLLELEGATVTPARRQFADQTPDPVSRLPKPLEIVCCASAVQLAKQSWEI
jgi:hypothetical protein